MRFGPIVWRLLGRHCPIRPLVSQTGVAGLRCPARVEFLRAFPFMERTYPGEAKSLGCKGRLGSDRRSG